MKRTAEKAGTWYDADANKLRTKLTNWINEATNTRTVNTNKTSIRAIIAPHAGYKFSGPVAAYAYEQIVPSEIKRIFLLGPAHYKHVTACCVSKANYCETPLGDIECDREMVNELKETGEFQEMTIEMDSEEHSIELHLPYIYHVMQGHPFKLVHILVGSINDQREEAYGKIFAKYLTDPNNLFVISSDFCHWGERSVFVPTFFNEKGQIYKYIEEMDREGITAIEKQNAKLFKEYLSTTKNTICGKKPIAILLNAIAHSKDNFDMKLVDYAQSSSCKNRSDSSVSYASLVLVPSEDPDKNSNNNNNNNIAIHNSDHRSNGAIFGEV